MWWFGAIFFGVIQLLIIIIVLTRVFRKKEKAWNMPAIGGYLIHGLIAVLALWMFLKAVA
jgi:hypothetical protein